MVDSLKTHLDGLMTGFSLASFVKAQIQYQENVGTEPQERGTSELIYMSIEQQSLIALHSIIKHSFNRIS